jgi:hypothetical protein
MCFLWLIELIMKYIRYSFFLFLFPFQCLLCAEAQERASYLQFQLDNDLFTGSDRNYTNGARLAWLKPIPVESMNGLQDWLRGLSGAGDNRFFSLLTSFIEPETVAYDWGTGLTQLMFTPEDYAATEAPPGQRPYAGWLGIEFSLHAKDARSLSSVLLSIGTTGENALAQETQEWVHRNISNSPIFQGWDSQVPGELTVNLQFDRKRRFTSLAEHSRDWLLAMDGYFEWGAALGNFRTDADVGALMRIGYNLPVQYVTPRIQLGGYAHELFLGEHKPAGRWSLYAFGGVRGTAVAHDITIDGPVFRDYDSPVSSEPLVGGALVGFGLRLQSLTVTYSRTFRTEEYSTQDGGHQFGSLLVSLGF